MNRTKTDFILFGNKKIVISKSVSTNRSMLQEKYKKNMDESLSTKSHNANKCRVTMLNIQWIKFIRLSEGLVITPLDYANATLAGLQSNLIDRVQKPQILLPN